MILESTEPSGIDLRLLRTFQAVIEAGSFVRAAEELGLAQSTVTVHVQQLERRLGVGLIERNGRRSVPTEAGRMLHEQAVPLLRQAATIEQTMAEFAGGEAGRLRLGAIEPAASFRLPALLVRYCHAHPRVNLFLEVGSGGGIAARVASGELDFGLSAPPPDPRLGLSFELLFREELTLLVPADHPLASGDVDLAAIAAHRLLISGPTCAYRALIEGSLSAHGIPLHDTLEIGNIMAIYRAVASGLGPAILPSIAAPPDLPGIAARDISHLELSLPVGIVRRRDDPPPTRAVEAMLTLLRTRLRVEC